MANFYFNNISTSNNDASTLENWWIDGAFTVQATSFPTTSDNVYVLSDITTGALDCNNLYFWIGDSRSSTGNIYYSENLTLNVIGNGKCTDIYACGIGAGYNDSANEYILGACSYLDGVGGSCVCQNDFYINHDTCGWDRGIYTYPDSCGNCDGGCTSYCGDCANTNCTIYSVFGCTDASACGYNSGATCDDGSCYWSCTDAGARNYHDGCNFCWYVDCNDSSACNYDSLSYGSSECSWGCNDSGARNHHDSCNSCWYTDCNISSACNYDSNSFGTSECSWACNAPGARNYHSDCNSCWYVDCNISSACNYDSNSFGASECSYGCNDSGARNYHSDCNSCWYVDCNDSGACNYDSNSFGYSECTYPSDGCHDCGGNCTCSNSCGCNTENDDCGNCVTVGMGCYSGCCGGTCGDYADSDYFGNSCCHSAIGTDSFGRALCDGSYGTCNDPTACGEDIYGCMYTRDTLGICYGDAVLDCAGNPYSPINELELDLPLVDGLFGQMYYNGGDSSASFSDGPNAENPQFFNLHPEYKTQTYTTTEIRNFYVNGDNIIQNLNPADFTQFNGSDALQQYSWQFVGRFRAPYTDDFSFSTWSDDASYLWLGANALTGYDLNNALVNNGGSHGNQASSSDPISLNSGEYYPIRIQYGQGGGDGILSVAYSSNTETNVTNWSGIAYSVPQCVPDFAINGQCCPSASGSLGSGLVAYWNFDNNLVDHTLHGYNLSGYSGYGYNSGIANSGVFFADGSGSFVNNLNISGEQTWSISCWFKFDNIYSDNYPQAIWGLGGGGYGDTTLYLNGTNGIALYSYGQGVYTSIIPNTGEWYYSTVNVSPTGLNLYINNNFAGSITDPSDNSFSGLSLSDFLGEGYSGMYTISATVDEMGFWNRELNANEVCNLYYNGSGNAFPFTKQPLCYTVIPPSSGMFIPNFIAPGLPISPAFNGQFQLSQLMGLPPTIQF